MVFKIVDVNSTHRGFLVADEAGNTLEVNGTQIVGVILEGNQCVNAEIIKGGFKVQFDNGQVMEVHPQLPSEFNSKINKMLYARRMEEKRREEELAAKKRSEAAKKAAATRAKNKAAGVKTSEEVKKETKSRAKGAKEVLDGKKVAIKSTRPEEKIFFNGKEWTVKQLCKKHGLTTEADIARFKKLKKDGYSTEVALGLEPMPKKKPGNQNLDAYLDRMDKERAKKGR